MNKYKNLVSNTLVFAIGTFSSKLLVFVMMRFYTELMSQEQYSSANLIVNACNLILPVMYLCISEGIIRFGLESDNKKSDIFSTGILTLLLGYLFLWCFYPVFGKVPELAGYVPYMYMFVFTSALRTVVTYFVRACGFVRLFALDGVVTTVLTVALNILFLAKFQMGVPGYILSTVLADGFSAVSLILILKLYRFFKLRGISRDTVKTMLRYSVPLVPTAVFWWVTNLSDTFFVKRICGSDINGLYTVAYKIPMMITMVSAIFTQAWQLSAFTEYKNAEGERFYATVFKSYYTFIFLAASGIILLIKPITYVLVSKSGNFQESWQYVPFLVLAVSFSCLVTFLGSVYNAARKNGMVTVTTFVGAAVNVVLNSLLIPVYGAQGAAVATFISFLVVFIIRAIDCQKYIRIRMQPLRILFNLLLLLTQVWVALTAPPLWPLWEACILLLIFLCNFGNILFLLRRLRGLIPSHG